MANVTQRLSTALQHHQAGRLQAAEQIYRQILQSEPNHADALHLLGVIFRQVGKHALAVQYIQRAIGLKGNVAAYHVNLANALKDHGKPSEAAASYRRALQLKPDFAEAHNNLGVLLKDQGKLDAAVACYRRALELEPDYAEAHNNLGYALHDLGNPDQAAVCYRRALDLQPHCVEAHNNLGNVLRDLGRADEAVACYRRALELKPDFAGAHKNLGDAFACLGKLEEAAACYRRAVQLMATAHPRDAETDNCLSAAFLQLATILRERLPDDDLLAMRNLSSQPGFPENGRANLEFGLAEALDARGDYSAAARHAAAANAARLAVLRAQGKEHNPATYAAFVDGLLATFTPEFFARTSAVLPSNQGWGLETEQPVFIVGLPRSGTTLAEQILASHSRVFGAGEVSYCGDTFRGLLKGVRKNDERQMTNVASQGDMRHSTLVTRHFEMALLGLDRETSRHLAWQYLDRLRALNESALRIVDKMPQNYHYLGFIRVLFPRARIIHCRRDLRDVALSCWITDFMTYRWACDADQIISYFEQYSRVMDHWRKVLPAPPLDVDYEEMVEDTGRVVRRIVEWCGLDWEPGCLRFYETQRPVSTASAAQVRRPIYKSSVGRWKNYEPLVDQSGTGLRNLFSAVHRIDDGGGDV